MFLFCSPLLPWTYRMLSFIRLSWQCTSEQYNRKQCSREGNMYAQCARIENCFVENLIPSHSHVLFIIFCANSHFHCKLHWARFYFYKIRLNRKRWNLMSRSCLGVGSFTTQLTLLLGQKIAVLFLLMFYFWKYKFNLSSIIQWWFPVHSVLSIALLLNFN